MTYAVFNIMISFAYLTGIVVLARELRASTKEEQRELQSVPLLFAATILYVVVISKTYQLAQMLDYL